jgi:bacillithiol biosynthesis cysteine-adding enzyme BshC
LICYENQFFLLFLSKLKKSGAGMFINFADLPDQHQLFTDYLYNFENVKNYYKYNFRNKEEYIRLFKKRAELQGEKRALLSGILRKQYSGIEPSERTTANLLRLEGKNTLAVVTGQQLGILGGPLYTFYKIVTAIKLCNNLNERYDDFYFVPLFWLEGDDHDFEEVKSINIIDENNNLKKISYEDEIPEEENKGSVGFLKLNSDINRFFDELGTELRDTEFKNDIITKLRSFYAEGRTFKDAFRDLIFWLFDDYGLLIFDPQDAEVKKLLVPVFKKEIRDFRIHSERLVNISAKLEEEYHAQVKVRPINLFYHTDEGRYLIEPVENDFRLRRKRRKFTFDELQDAIDREPERFSPNVLLRPICQDYLLPTAFYIGGPSEISYFAQVTPLYNIYQIEPPILYPRSSATLIEKNIALLLEKYNLNLDDIFTESEKLKNRIIEIISPNSLDDIFSHTSNEIELIYDKLKERLFEFDKTIADASTKYRQKTIHYLDELKGKAIDAQKKKHEVTLRQIDKLSTALYPASNLQERELNFVYFAYKYGPDFISKLFSELSINKFEHQGIMI